MSVDQQVFLVTGASSGIGKAIAEALVAKGARVVVMARTAEALAAIASAAPDRVAACPGDVTVEADCRAAVAAATTRFGRLDGVIHSAGISMRGLAAETQMAVFRRLIEVNYFSTVALAHAALPALTASRGHFVVISSVVGKFASPLRSGYAASKHAVQAFLDALRVEQAAAGVHVMAVLPGYVRTNVSLNALTADGSPHGRMDTTTDEGLAPEAVAEAVIEGMRRRRAEVTIAGRTERLGLLLKRFAPRLLDRVLHRRFMRDAEGIRAPQAP